MFRPTLRVYGSLSRRHHHHHGWNFFLNDWNTQKCFSCLNISFSNFSSFFFYWFFLLIWLLFFTSRRKKYRNQSVCGSLKLWSHSSRAWLFYFFHPQFRDWSSALLKSDWFSRKERKMFFFPTFLDAGGCRFSIHGHYSGSQSLLCPIQKLYIRHCC